MRRQPPAQGGALREGGRQDRRRPGGDAGRRTDRVLRRAGTGRARHEDRGANPRGNPQPPAIPGRRGAGLPDARPPFVDPIGRRKPAHQPLDVAGQQPHGVALHPRRAFDRPAPARHEPPDQGLAAIARPGQHGDRRGARGGGDPRRRLHRRHRPQGGLQRRRGGLQRHAAPTAQKQEEPHGRLPDRAPRDSAPRHRTRLEQLDPHRRGA